MATTLDCLLSPIACAQASEAARTARASMVAARGGASGTQAGATIAAADVVEAATAPLAEISSTAMWTTIGIIVAVAAVLLIFGYIVFKVETA